MIVYDMYQMMLTQEARVYKTLEELYYPSTGVRHEIGAPTLPSTNVTSKESWHQWSRQRERSWDGCVLYKLTIQRNHPGNQARALFRVEWARSAAQVWPGALMQDRILLHYKPEMRRSIPFLITKTKPVSSEMRINLHAQVSLRESWMYQVYNLTYVRTH